MPLLAPVDLVLYECVLSQMLTSIDALYLTGWRQEDTACNM